MHQKILVGKYNNIFYIIVLALIGNKSDVYDKEEVSKDEGLSLAKEINAIFQYTSTAKSSDGINNIFIKIGKKFVDTFYKASSQMAKEDLKSTNESIKIRKIKKRKKKKKCC